MPPTRLLKGGNSPDYQLMFLGDVDAFNTIVDGQALVFDEASDRFKPVSNAAFDANISAALAAAASPSAANPIITEHGFTSPQTVIGMGDSLSDNTYEATLAAQWAGWTVTESGVGGNTTLQMLNRFGTDVIIAGAQYVIVWGGVNDLLGSHLDATTIETNLQAMYTLAHNANIKVIALTISPLKGHASVLAGDLTTTTTVNTWIKSTALNIDTVVDAYTVLNDPGNPGALLAAYDSGDHCHLSAAGYIAVANAIAAAVTPAAPTVSVSFAPGATAITQRLGVGDSPTFASLNLGSNILNGTALSLVDTHSTAGFDFTTRAIYNSVQNDSIAALGGLVLGATALDSHYNAVEIYSGSPIIQQQIERATGGFSLAILSAKAKNTTTSTVEGIAQIGVTGSVSTDPMSGSLYISAAKNASYSDNQFVLQQNGYLGLNVNPPVAHLHVRLLTAGENLLRLDKDASTYWTFIQSGTSLRIYDSGTYGLSFNAGNCGFGVDPAYKMDLDGNFRVLNSVDVADLPSWTGGFVNNEIFGVSSANARGHLRLSAGGATNAGYKTGIDLAGYTDSAATINSITFYTAGTQFARINSAGNLLLGTAAADGLTAAGSLAIAKDLAHRGTLAGFYNHAPAAQQTKAGHNNWAALSDVVAALVAIGLFDAA